ncbi:MAG: hypothetical protein Q4D12_02135 [Bacteroidales bacterium]|nr:hypothetical protein [Bacteroidales bacterium]
MDDKERFLELIRSTRREGVDGLLEWLEETDFYQAPASAHNHDAFTGGLLYHSLKAFDIAMKLRQENLENRPDLANYWPVDSIILCTLLHDVCKIGLYRLKDDGKFTRLRRTLGKLHGRLSVQWIEEHGLTLTGDEKHAIRWHMGPYTQDLEVDEWPSDVKEAMTHPLSWLVHKADLLSCK